MRKDNLSPQEKEEPPEPGLGPMGFGVLLGTVALFGMAFLAGPAALIPIAVYLVVAIVLAVRPRTSRWGAGLLIGLGIFTLAGAGICVGYLAQVRP
ncbi:hypothetical protein QFZ35_000474 [Arthrobacter ulcerisalmonis]|nr:hypothetical protein [Arthrobacter ulcerisalmonis]MDQ0729897.1 hypothetical protein [Arthrobacter sp. B1I2]